jgi:hypothetical protein
VALSPILHAPFLLDSLDVFFGSELGEEVVGCGVVALGEGEGLWWAIAQGLFCKFLFQDRLQIL